SYIEYENNEISSLHLADSLNILIKIEYISHGVLFLVLCLFIKYTYVAVFLNAFIIAYHIKKYCTFFVHSNTSRYLDKTWLLDPAEVYSEVKKRKPESVIKLICYVLLFGFYLYRYIFYTFF